MDDPFNILGQEMDTPARFEDAVRDLLERLGGTYARFEQLEAQVPHESYTDEEWQLVESTAEQVAEAVERAEEGYVAVMFDSHAWYRITENLEQINMRLESAIGVMERVRDRTAV